MDLDNAKVSVKTRYSARNSMATLSKVIKDNKEYIKVKFDEPELRATPGQSAVFYDGDVLLGGGIIC